MINKLLISCLHRNKRIIIPTLGAFIRKSVDGVGVILVFVPFLNKDDGILRSALQAWAGVEREDAQIILDEYVESIRQSLKTRGQYIIEGVGVLKFDPNGVIYLAKASEAAPAVAATPTPAATEATTPAPQPQFVVESTMPENPEPLVVLAPEHEQAEAAEQQAPVSQEDLKENIQQEVAQEQEQVTTEEPAVEKQIIEPIQEEVEVEVEIEEEVETIEPEPIVEPEPLPEPEPQPEPIPAPKTVGTTQSSSVRGYYSPKSAAAAANQAKDGSAEQRKSTINNLYGTRPRSTGGAIYGSAALRGSQQTPSSAAEPAKPAAKPTTTQATAPQPSNGQQAKVKRPTSTGGNRKDPKPKKGIDMVMVIAVAAVFITIASLLYALVFSPSASLDEQIIVDQPIEQAVEQQDQPADSL